MNFWWEVFNKTGSLDAYINYKEEEKEKEDATHKDDGDSGALNDGGRL